MQSEFACSLCLEPEQHTSMIWNIHFSPDEKKLLTQSEDGTAKVWDVQTGELLLTTCSYKFASRLSCFSPCGEYIISATARGKDLNLLKSTDGSEVATAAGAFDGSKVYSACFSPDGSRVAAGSSGGDVSLFSVPDLRLLTRLGMTSVDPVHSLVFTRDGNTLLVADECVEVWDVAPGAEAKIRHKLCDDDDAGAYTVCLSPDGTLAAAKDGEGRVAVWNLASGSRLLGLATGDAGVQCAGWLPSGETVVTYSEDEGRVRFWSFSSADPTSSGQLLSTIDVFEGRPQGVLRIGCISPSGSLLAVGGIGGNERPFVRVFRAPTLSPLQQQLGDLLRSKRAADVMLACGGIETSAHSLILALRSGTLRRQLDWGAERAGGAGSGAAGPAGSGGGARLEIDASVEPAILERLLEYLYTDHLVIRSAEEAQHLLHAASFYDVPGLFQLSAASLETRLAVENVIETLIAADKYGAAAAGLTLAALRFVKENTTAVVVTPGWDRLPKRLMTDFVYFQATGQLPPAATAAEGVGGGKGGSAAGDSGRNVRQRTGA